MNNEFFNNNVETNGGEENIILAPPTELFDEANEIANNTSADEKYPFKLQYSANQKEHLQSMLKMVGAIIENEVGESNILFTRMNMAQLAFIKCLNYVERVRTDEGVNPFLAEETITTEVLETEMPSNLHVEMVAQQTTEPVKSTQSMAVDTSEVLSIVTEPIAAKADDSIAVAYVDCSSSPCDYPTNTSMETAKEIQVESFVSACICCPCAEQWFKFTVPQTKQYTICTSGSLDTVGTLYDCYGNYITEVDDISGKLNFRIVRTLTAGITYYVRVRLADNDTGCYTVNVTEKVFANYVTINKDSITLVKGVTYELPITPNYVYKGYNGAQRIPDLSVSITPSNTNEQKIWWYEQYGDVLDCSYGWDDDGDRYIHVTTTGTGTAKLYAVDWNENGKRDECMVTVVTPYVKQLQTLGGFSSEEATLIQSLYDKIDATFSSENRVVKAWKYARILSEISYDYTTSIAGFPFNRWDDVAGSVTTQEDRKTYFINTLGYTENQYNKLNEALVRNHQDANNNHNVIDFTHMQYALAARLAYTLNEDGILSNLGTGLYTGNYGIYNDEEISYLGGWFGDAILTNMYGVGQTVMKNDDYMSDLDAENIYRLIIQGYSAIDAANEYYSNMSSSNTRANIFLQYIPYNTVKEKIFYELIDAQLYASLANASNQGNIILINYYLDLIKNEKYHFDTIKANYYDTYNFLKSLNDRRLTMEEYP